MSSNPNEYAARLLEAEAEKSSWMTLLPIFYYNETLFPGGRLDLHLFEPRYRVMMQRVVNSTRSFAYVANFNQYRAHVGDVALIAVLEEVEFMADGRCMLQAKLSSRMIIADHYGKNYCIFLFYHLINSILFHFLNYSFRYFCPCSFCFRYFVHILFCSKLFHLMDTFLFLSSIIAICRIL